jgi:hypothetical protein
MDTEGGMKIKRKKWNGEKQKRKPDKIKLYSLIRH